MRRNYSPRHARRDTISAIASISVLAACLGLMFTLTFGLFGFINTYTLRLCTLICAMLFLPGLLECIRDALIEYINRRY